MKKKTFTLIVLILSMTFLFVIKTPSAFSVTQGEYAVQLAEKLGLGEGLTVDEAIAALTDAGIVPADGWEATATVTPDFVNEVAALVVTAAREGAIPVSLDKVADIVTSLASEMGIEVTLPPPPPPLTPPPPPPPVPPASPSE
jgi:hypothetical protein